MPAMPKAGYAGRCRRLAGIRIVKRSGAPVGDAEGEVRGGSDMGYPVSRRGSVQ